MKKSQRSLSMLALIISGEAIFILPFVLARVFKPTLLEVFDISNFQLGTIFAFYGIIAVFAYLFGGPLADRFPARNLIVFALISTALGGIFLATIPNYYGMQMLFGFWGLTTILLFWAALIKATREIGADKFQGIAFGFLDGGRGLVAALIGTITVWIFSQLLPVEPELANLAHRTYALKGVIYIMTVFILLVSFATFFLLPAKNTTLQSEAEKIRFNDFGGLLALPTIWLQAIIILCAYVGYKAVGDFSQYAKEVMHFNDVQSAYSGAVALWTRPFAAVFAGILAYKVNSLKLIMVSFSFMFVGCIVFALGWISLGENLLFFCMILTTCLGVFALRALYFAIMQEAKIPLVLTGSAVGIISVIGYAPDIFMGPLTGYLLDRHPGKLIGHQHLFIVLAGFSLIGLVAAMIFAKISKNSTSDDLNPNKGIHDS